jgi:hypothetical protein
MENRLLNLAKDYAVTYLQELPERKVFPDQESQMELEKLDFPLPASSTDPEKVLSILNTVGSTHGLPCIP